MQNSRALVPAVVAVALLAPGSANARSALTDSLREATLGTFVKTAKTASGQGDSSCLPAGAASKPFAAWGDRADYVEAPGGSFEPGAANSWAAAGPVSTVRENEPWQVSGRSSDGHSIVLAGGNASITSATLCAGLAYPTIRFFAKAPRGTALALVTVRYTGPDGLLAALPLGLVRAGSQWQPTSLSLTASGVPLFTGTTMSIRIAPVFGTVQVDDVYVDPFRRS